MLLPSYKGLLHSLMELHQNSTIWTKDLDFTIGLAEKEYPNLLSNTVGGN